MCGDVNIDFSRNVSKPGISGWLTILLGWLPTTLRAPNKEVAILGKGK